MEPQQYKCDKCQKVFPCESRNCEGCICQGAQFRYKVSLRESYGKELVTSSKVSLFVSYRFVFIAGPNDGEPSLPQLLKGNKSASEALCSVLHLDDENSADSLVASDVVADINSSLSMDYR